MEGGHHANFPVDAAALDGEADPPLLQQQPHLQEIGELVGRYRRDREAALVLEYRESVAHQARQRLAQGAGAKSIGIGEVSEAQTLPRLQHAADDVAAHLVISGGDQGPLLAGSFENEGVERLHGR